MPGRVCKLSTSKHIEHVEEGGWEMDFESLSMDIYGMDGLWKDSYAFEFLF